jgi:exopolysaccharide biosynthesis polyprenyl glycosylphosphotransferase
VPTLTHAASERVGGPSPPAATSSESLLASRYGWTLVCLGLDVAMLAIATITAVVGSSAAGIPTASVEWLVAFPAIVLVLLYLRRMYATRLSVQVLDQLKTILSATALGAMAVISLRAFVADDPHLVGQTVRLWAFSTVYLSAGRVSLAWAQVGARRHDRLTIPTLIVGAGKIGHLTARRLREHPEFGLRPIGFLDKEPLEGGPDALPVLGASWDLEHVVKEHGVGHVVIAFSTAPHQVFIGIVERCEQLGVAVSQVPRLFEKMTDRVTVEHLGGLPLVSVTRSDPEGWHFAAKYAIDRIVALLLILLISPVLLAATVAVLISLSRPIFYRQRRVGLDGRPFDILKFRSMRPPETGTTAGLNHEQFAEDGIAPGGVEGEDRRTRVGAFLRRTSIDELPQLFNVLKGEMSLVGPRPERPEFVELFEDRIHRYDERHRVKSGITGWAQVHGLRGNTSLSDRVEWDNYYIENWSLWLDVKILLLTLAAVVNHDGA